MKTNKITNTGDSASFIWENTNGGITYTINGITSTITNTTGSIVVSVNIGDVLQMSTGNPHNNSYIKLSMNHSKLAVDSMEGYNKLTELRFQYIVQ